MATLKFTVSVAVPEGIDVENIDEEVIEHFGRFHLESGKMTTDDPFYDAIFDVNSVCFEEIVED